MSFVPLFFKHDKKSVKLFCVFTAKIHFKDMKHENGLDLDSFLLKRKTKKRGALCGKNGSLDSVIFTTPETILLCLCHDKSGPCRVDGHATLIPILMHYKARS